MVRLGTAGKLTASVSALGGAISILSLLLRFHPALENAKYLKEAIELYAHYIRAPLAGGLAALFPAGSSWIAGAVGDALVFWMTFFLAVNVFVYRHSRRFLPGYIADNYCHLAPRRKISRFFCAMPKLVIAFLAAPIVCTALALMKIGSGANRLYSVAYMTIQPKSIFTYIVAMAAIVAGAIAVAEFVLGANFAATPRLLVALRS